MIIQYKFAVKGNLAFQDNLAFRFNGRTYSFEVQDGRLSYLIVQVKGDAKDEAPKVSSNEENGKRVQLKCGHGYPFIQMEVRNLEGILGPFGVEEIDIYKPEFTWIAENPEETKDIHIKKYQVTKSENLGPTLPSDIMARSIMAAYDAHEMEVPLTFYRKAFASYRQSRFLESCYDYFFFLECLFGDSKVKKADVQKKFKEAAILQYAIVDVLNDDLCINELARVSAERFKKLKTKSAEEVSDSLVEFRGEIHHYKPRHKKKWHPSKPGEAEFEATLFKHLAGSIALKMVVDSIYDDKILLSNIQCLLKCKNDAGRFRGTNEN